VKRRAYRQGTNRRIIAVVVAATCPRPALQPEGGQWHVQRLLRRLDQSRHDIGRPPPGTKVNFSVAPILSLMVLAEAIRRLATSTLLRYAPKAESMQPFAN
jgi:hypothetical protein